MANIEKLPTTQRAYTLRLRSVDPTDHSWRDALWATHEAVNKGAKVFGDWLLTLRGGLDHKLADLPAKEKADTTRLPTEAERRNRRILLALSWLSVEDERGAPKDKSLIVAKGTDSTDCRARKLGDALSGILKARGVADAELGDVNKRPEDQPDTWLGDCMPSLSAEIREDAVWINRSAAFDSFAIRTSNQADRDYAARTVLGFLELKGPYFELPSLNDNEEAKTTGPTEEKPLVNEATGWLSKNWGAGGKSDKTRISGTLARLAIDLECFVGKPGRELIREFCRRVDIDTSSTADTIWLKALIDTIGWKGRPSAGRMAIESVAASTSLNTEMIEKLKDKLVKEGSDNLAKSKIEVPAWMPAERSRLEQLIGLPYRSTKDHTFEFAVMFDHALRKLSSTHSWIKNAEAQRQKFESDAKRLECVPQIAVNWLRQYCEDRADASGALDAYRIRKRAIDGWDNVVVCWSRANCITVEDRIAAARHLQDDPEIDKFGDILLFEALAVEDAICVWKPEGTATAQPLKDFVAAAEAMEKRKRFKVPAYRHPDPLYHPIFTDFGNSRWGIDFSAHRAPAMLAELQKKVQKRVVELEEVGRKSSVVTEKQRAILEKRAIECRDKLRDAEQDLEAMRDQRRLKLRVWNGRTVEPIALRWSCKRLHADLALSSAQKNANEHRINVCRADRLGLAAVSADRSSDLNVAGLFEQDYWNGRLQAPRAQPGAIARHVERHGWDEKAYRKLKRIRWIVTFSAKFTQIGPWSDYCETFSDGAPAKPIILRNGEYTVKHRDNDKRMAHAKHILSRLPGLRLLSVDLGHRYAAACAVWESITQEQMAQACYIAHVPPPDADTMFLHLAGTNSQGRPNTTIYRRIGSDKLPDGSGHPAPWARLDRQFLIKLQGEDRTARKASPGEIEQVEQFEQWVGRVRFGDDRRRDLVVDALMSDVVRTAKLALARHSRRARIAHQLTAASITLPGARQQLLDDPGRIELLMKMLIDWHALANDSIWDDSLARQLWNESLADLAGGFRIDAPCQPTRIMEEHTKADRHLAEDTLRQRLQPLALTLMSDELLRQKLHDAWTARWTDDDRQWKQKLKWLSRWLMPRGGSRRDAARRHVGGLSLTRISTLTEFRRKVQVGFFTRMKPDGLPAEIGPKFGQSTLDAIQCLKDQRIKQLASRIVEAALGVGVERRGESGRDLVRPKKRNGDNRFSACHAVVIEDLSRYRPEETRTRRENRATMDWKSAETRKRLADHCQLYGLYLRDVNPQYTSRQDSRTGAPGIRCLDVPVAEFLEKPWWRKQVIRARNKVGDNKGDARDCYLLALDQKWSNALESDIKVASPLRIPVPGGEIFVSVDEQSPLTAGIQADLNAAANIGLRALMDPDFPAKWWYVPCDPKTGKPIADRVKGSILDNVSALRAAASELNEQTKQKKPRGGITANKNEIVNLWRDPSHSPILGAEHGDFWLETPHYWNMVKEQAIRILRRRSGLE